MLYCIELYSDNIVVSYAQRVNMRICISSMQRVTAVTWKVCDELFSLAVTTYPN